ncbi:MAG: 2-oxoacid:ferredoxin oxidoreductase subunit beta [Synergistaceae bacterium]|jgi:2-oxoglutarate ferredoxin oxidoreductase subunit beta|nr:2-oxoacid:ferredoxin oxidoreductase subunit beta [Synergistaceae bacterium]
MPREDVMKWLRQQFMPHIWCPGCGHGIIMHAMLRALTSLGKDPSKTVISSGIGCSSRMPGYIDSCTLHTAHGRSLAFATGVKLCNPELTVIDVMGDGDCSAIGGNHFIHACRRNIGVCAIVMNNNIYGMTGGQASPTTPIDAIATTAPYGAVDPPFDICRLAIGAGATFVARATIAQPQMCETLIKKGIQHDGFSVIEIMTHCHTQFGRKNKRSRPLDNFSYFKDRSVLKAKADGMTQDELSGKYVIGELHLDSGAEEYTKKYDKVIERAGR